MSTGEWLALNGRPMRMAQPPPLREALAVLLVDDPLPEWPVPLSVRALADVDDQQALLMMLVHDQARLEDFHVIADAVARVWFKWPRWSARVLWRTAWDSWPTVDGELLMRGVDIETMEVGRATNTIWALLRSWWGSTDRWDSFVREVQSEPLRLTSGGGSVTAAAAMDAFDAFAAALGGVGEARGAPSRPAPAVPADDEDDEGPVLVVRP